MTSLLYELFQNFILGGLITATISYIGTYMDPLLGAIWWSFPISLIPTIYFMKDTGKSNKFIAKFTIRNNWLTPIYQYFFFCIPTCGAI